jgi:cell division protein FtsI (penicillin-binding protein 3)
MTQSDKRVRWVKIALLAAFVVVVLRLIQVQVIDAPYYQRKARAQYEVPVELLASRGNIADRNGRLIVSNLVNASFVADPQRTGNNAGVIAGRFAQVFGKPRSHYLALLQEKGRRFVWLERSAPPQFATFIDTKKYKGILVVNEPRRIYHYGAVAGQIVGSTNIDNKGITGIEYQYDAALRGQNGSVTMQNDGLNQPRPSVEYPRRDPVNGKDVALTIDIDYQTIVEEELRRGVEATRAEGGLAVMMNPSTGEVLAVSQYPGFNPALPSDAVSRIRVVADMFEPGSMFKLVVASAALEDALVKPTQRFNAENGRYVRVIGRERLPITDTHPYSSLTFQEAVEFSSNIVIAKVSDVVGNERFYRMARQYGFGTETGVELPGEIAGDLKRPHLWSGTTLNSMAIGYEVGVTPLQIVTAYSVIANGGMLVKPYILKAVVDEHGEILEQGRPQQIRRVITKATAQTMTRFLEGVVERGTGKAAQVPGLRIAGKTGTARKNVDGKYETNRHTTSFVGFFPANAPEIVCLVMLDHPREGGQTGGMASAPIFREIARKVSVLGGRGRRTSPEVQAAAVPDVIALSLADARSEFAGRGYEIETKGSGTIVKSQTPAAGTRLARGGRVTVTLTTPSGTGTEDGFTIVPPVAGLSMRRAASSLALHRLDPVLTGSGTVTAQTPAAGTKVRAGTRVTVRCEPKTLSLVDLN